MTDHPAIVARTRLPVPARPVVPVFAGLAMAACSTLVVVEATVRAIVG